jgi:transcriptional regulator with XRE-family HTH domain
MATGSSSPTARRFELARRLRELRQAAGKSVEEVAAELMCSSAKISRMETAGRSIQSRDVRDLCRFYGVSRRVQDELMQFAAEAGRRGWWQDYRVLDEQTKTFLGLESAATEMLEFETLRMPGLLQTADYTRAWVDKMRPPNFWSPGQIDEIVEVRARRQTRVTAGTIRLHAIVDEAAFARIVGSWSIMADQVKRLAELAVLDNVELQVIPFSKGPHPGLDGSFQLLHVEAGSVGDVVFIEGQLGNQILDKIEDVQRFQDVHRSLASEFAMTEAQTIDWLREHQGQLVASQGGVTNTLYRRG